MGKRNINISIESIMVVILMILFAVSLSVLIYEGSKTYRKIIDNNSTEENTRIALSYVNMRIKQNDRKGAIEIRSDLIAGKTVLVVNHGGEEKGFSSYIYSQDGFLWENYTDEIFDPNLSIDIIPVNDMTFSYSDNMKQIITTINYENASKAYPIVQKTTLRTR